MEYFRNLLIISFLVFFTLPIVATSVNADTNLVGNPSFETGATVPNNWTFITRNGITPTWDNVSHNGTKSIKISIPGKRNKVSGYPISDMISVTPLTTYTVSAWGKTVNISGKNGPIIRIVQLNSNKVWIGETNILEFSKGTNNWVQKSSDFKTLYNTAYLYVYGDIRNGYGTFGLDEVAISLKTTPTPTVTPTPISPPDELSYDDFNIGMYSLKDGDISPNSKWKCLWNGYGSSGVNSDAIGNYFFMYPSTSKSSFETSSNLVTSTQNFTNFEFTIDVKTVKQLRQNTPPNAWEVAWAMFRFTDETHYYYFMVKTNGIELGKYDGGNPITGQQILYTAETPKVTIGKLSTWEINVVGNHILIYVDGFKVVDYIDKTASSQLKSGSIGMYNEDALVNFDNVKFRVI